MKMKKDTKRVGGGNVEKEGLKWSHGPVTLGRESQCFK